MTVMTDLLLEEDLPAEKRLEFLKGISAQLEKMQWMITTLLKISKFDAARQCCTRSRWSWPRW